MKIFLILIIFVGFAGFTGTVFVWESLENPSALSPLLSLEITVKG